MSSQKREEETFQEEIVLCARCAWREFCVKKFSMDNIKPIKCPDFSLDVRLKKEREGDKEKDKGDS